MRRWELNEAVWLVIILACAAAARFWYLYDLADGATTEGPVQVQEEDPRERLGLMKNLREGHQFAGPAPLSAGEEVTASVAPGYPWLLSLAAGWTDDWESLVRWIQGALGAVTAGLYFLFARRAFRSLPVAVLAGLFTAVYPFWVVNAAQLTDGVLTTFLLALALVLGARASQVGGPTTSLFYGFSLAGLAMVRAALLPFAVAAMLWFLLRCRGLRRGWFCALLAFLGFINGLVPWTLRNLQLFGDVLPIVDSTYLHLWIGNHPGADGGPLDELALEKQLEANLAPGRPGAGREELDRLRRMKQNERYYALAPLVVDNIASDPGGFFQHRLSAGLCFVFGADWFRLERRLCQGDQGYAGIFYGSLLALLILAFLGWRWTYPWRSLAMPSSLALIWIPLPYILGHAGALSGARLPLDGVLLCYAAFALVYLVPRFGLPLFRGPQEKVE